MSSSKDNLPWIEKHRPKHLDEIIDHVEKVTSLKGLIDADQLPHLLFSGPPGTGKTSLILSLARYMYGTNYRKYILEINGSSERGIDTVRGTIMSFIQNRSDKVKIVILDEADALTNEAQGALKSVIEKGVSFCRFCLICNDVNKIIPALQSRCTKFPFAYLSKESMKTKMTDISRIENIQINEAAIDVLLELERDFRQLLNILQGMNIYFSSLGHRITVAYVYKYLGKPTDEAVTQVINSLFNDTFDEACELLQTMSLSGHINISDLTIALSSKVVRINLKPDKLYFLIQTLSEVEKKSRLGCSTQILIYLLSAAFLKVRNEISNES
jgi:replication factor C subunit 3/5